MRSIDINIRIIDIDDQFCFQLKQVQWNSEE